MCSGQRPEGGTEPVSFERADSCWANRHEATFSDTRHSAVWLFVDLACKQSQLRVCLDDSFTFHKPWCLWPVDVIWALGGRTIVLEFAKAKATDNSQSRSWDGCSWAGPSLTFGGPGQGYKQRPIPATSIGQEASRCPTYEPKLLVCGRNEDLCFCFVVLFCVVVFLCFVLFLADAIPWGT